MGATIRRESDGIWVLGISGALREEELDQAQAAALREMPPGVDAQVLILVEDDFLGWVGGEVWNDMTFFVQHGDQIAKIAIVGQEKWRDRMLMFTAAGMRRAPVQFFSRERLAEARAWLS